MRCFTCARSLHNPCTIMQVSVRKDKTSNPSHMDLLSFTCWVQGLLFFQSCGLSRARGSGKRISFHTFPCAESAHFTPVGQVIVSAIAAMKQNQIHPPHACSHSSQTRLSKAQNPSKATNMKPSCRECRPCHLPLPSQTETQHVGLGFAINISIFIFDRFDLASSFFYTSCSCPKMHMRNSDAAGLEELMSTAANEAAPVWWDGAALRESLGQFKDRVWGCWVWSQCNKSKISAALRPPVPNSAHWLRVYIGRRKENVITLF